MTKAHLKCIDTVKHLLTPEQFKTLLELASAHKQKAQAKKVDMDSNAVESCSKQSVHSLSYDI